MRITYRNIPLPHKQHGHSISTTPSYINLPKDRDSFACISGAFQLNIEHSNCHSIRINNRELSAFRHHFRFQNRRDALRTSIHLRPIPLRVKELELWGSKEIEGEEVLEAARIDNEAEMIERAVNGDQEVLSGTFAIPKVLGVTKFTMDDCLRCRIEPASIVMLAARMPDLKEWAMGGIS